MHCETEMAGERRRSSSDSDQQSNPEKGEKKETELEKYWKAVRENSTDFTGWTYLLQYVEQENNVEDAREAFDTFFGHYPYCYGYWKKYADIEKKNDNRDKAIEIFERGLKAIPLSVELWLHYINFMTVQTEDCEEEEEMDKKIRNVYERSIASAGTDFRSDRLWDSYINWEKQQKNYKKVTALYDKLLTIPLQLYSHHFDNFKAYVQNHHPKEILSLDEFLKLRQEIVSQTTELSAAEDEDIPVGGCSDEAPPGEEAPPGLENEGGKSDEVEATKLRDKIIEIRQIQYRHTENEVSKRWVFEEGIKRPYFHVKPLERSQLKNWKDYIDFEIEYGSHERVVVLFERCMIACALYEDFWMKYAKYIEQHSADAARNVYRRACSIHLPKKPSIHLAWAAFEERQDNHAEAWEILANLEKNVPGLAMVALRRISLERRQENFADAEQLYKDYIENAASNEIMAFLSIKYARFLLKTIGNPEQARTVLLEAIEKDPKNSKLFLQLLDIEYQTQPLDEESVLKTFSKMLSSEISLQTKIKFSQRRVEFLEDFGSNISKLLEAYEDHQKLLKEAHVEKKRKQLESGEEPPEKKSKADSTPNGAGEQSMSNLPTSANDSGSNMPQVSAYSYPSHWGSYSNTGYGYPHSHWGSYGTQYYPS